MLIRLLFLLKESFLNLKLLLLILIFSGFLLFNTLGLLKKIYSQAHDYFGLDKHTVYFMGDASEKEIMQYIEVLKENKHVKSIEFISNKSVKEKITKTFPEIAIEMAAIQLEDFPSYADVTFYQNSQNILEEQLKQMRRNTVVNQVVGYRDYTLQVVQLLEYIKYIAYGIIGIFLAVFCFSTLIVIQHTIFRNFDEIYVMKILGASNLQIVKPYVIGSTLISSFVFAFSFIFSVLSLAYISTLLSHAGFIFELKNIYGFISPIEILMFYLAVILLSMFGSLYTAIQAISQINRMAN